MNKVIKLFAIVAIMASSLALEAQNFDFSASCESGQTLYYKITGSNEVEITYPNTDMFPYLGPQMPVGNVTIPSMVTFEGHEYEVTAIGVKGDIDVQGPVILDSTAIIMGNIKSKSIQINNGAAIEGLCSQCYAEVNPSSFFTEG